ncbi:unnamed protein product [Arctogadus glacialis]
MEKKRKGGARNSEIKKDLEETGAKCAKISDMFAATASPASLEPPSTTLEIAAAEAKQDVGGGDGEGIEWRPRTRAAIHGAGGLGSGEVAATLSPRDVAGMCLSLVWTSQAFFTFVFFGVKVCLPLMWQPGLTRFRAHVHKR